MHVVAERVRVVGAGPAGALFAHAVERKENAQPVARVVEKLEAIARIVRGFRDVEIHGAHIVVVGGVLQRIAREAHCRVLAQGQVDDAPENLLVVVARLGFDGQFPTAEPRPPGDDVDGTGGGIASAQGALGPDVDFHPADVEEGGADAGGARQVNAVEVRRRGRVAEFGVVGGSDSANPHFDVAALVADLQARRELAQVGEVLGALHLQIVALEAVGGRTEVLEVLFAPLYGHDHLFVVGDRFVFGLIGLGFAGDRQRGDGEEGQCSEYCFVHHVSFHLFTPPLLRL